MQADACKETHPFTRAARQLLNIVLCIARLMQLVAVENRDLVTPNNQVVAFKHAGDGFCFLSAEFNGKFVRGAFSSRALINCRCDAMNVFEDFF